MAQVCEVAFWKSFMVKESALKKVDQKCNNFSDIIEFQFTIVTFQKIIWAKSAHEQKVLAGFSLVCTFIFEEHTIPDLLMYKRKFYFILPH